MSKIVDTILLNEMKQDDDWEVMFSPTEVSEEAIDTLMGYNEETEMFEEDTNELFPQPYDPNKIIDEIGVE